MNKIVGQEPLPKVCIMMSTYNGELYLRKQLDTILQQREVEIDLYIRDDASTDGTKAILSEYEQMSNVYVSYEENIGVGPSFMKLIYQVPKKYKYYAFADQDDIWLEFKIKRSIDMLTRGYMLYASNQLLIDKNEKILGMRYTNVMPHNIASIINCNHYAGCTMVFTSELVEILSDYAVGPSSDFLKIRIHDVWVISVASCFSKIYCDNESYIHYRQHENNVVGGKKKSVSERIGQVTRSLSKDKKKIKYRSMLAMQLKESLKNYKIDDFSSYTIALYSNTNSLSGKVKFLLNRKMFSEFPVILKVKLKLLAIIGLI